MYRPKDWKQKPYELPSVPVQVAADQVVEFMKKVDSKTMLCHGRDIVHEQFHEDVWQQLE